MADTDDTTTGGEHTRDDYLTEEDRAEISRYAEICAQRPPMTQEQINTVAAVFRRIDARREG